jgi:hypothetical protein
LRILVDRDGEFEGGDDDDVVCGNLDISKKSFIFVVVFIIFIDLINLVFLPRGADASSSAAKTCLLLMKIEVLGMLR